MKNPIAEAIDVQQSGDLPRAAQMFRSILRSNPNEPFSLYSLGIIVLGQGNKDEALALFQHGCATNPDFAYNWFGAGHTPQGLGRYEEALAAYDEATRIKPDYLEALINSGVLLREMHRHLDALYRFNRVLEIDPNYQNALGNCAILLTEFKESAKAIQMLQRLLALNPDYDYGPGLLIYEQMHIADWSGFAEQRDAIIAGVRAGKRTCKSLAFMALSDDAEDQYRCAKIFAEHFCAPARAPLWQGETYQHERLRIAYLSPDLREHPVGHLTCGIFENHDKSRFETIAISLGINDNSRLRQRMLNAFDHFIDVRGMPSQQIAEKIREMEVDIVIDLAGYTADSRIDIFSYRPAPVHINFLGYPGTLAVDYMDYILADRHVIPPEHQAFYQEKVLYLPDTYLPTDSRLQPAEETPSREACGLPPTGIVFCSFSHDYKISPPLWKVWMSLLQRTPGSVLWLVARNPDTQNNLRQSAATFGIAPERLIFAGRVPRVEDHLARYRLADIFLDTWPYNAHTTAADALISGLPVVTYMGNAFPARVAGSLLHAIDLPELITHTWEDYENLAFDLVSDPTRLAALKQKLLDHRFSQSLFDTARFTRNLEEQLLAVAKHKPSPATEHTSTDLEWLPLLDQVALQLDQSNPALAERILYHFLRLSPKQSNHPRVSAYQARIADGYGITPQFRLPVTPAPRDRHLAIRAWGYGFGSELHHLAGQLFLAEMTGRTAHVVWGSHCRFSNPETHNGFTQFFEPIGNVEFFKGNESHFPPKWPSLEAGITGSTVNTWNGAFSRLNGPYFFNRPEQVVISDFFTPLAHLMPWLHPSSPYSGMDEEALYGHLIRKYLHPRQDIISETHAFYEKNLSGRAWLAVHAWANDPNREEYLPFVQRIQELNPGIGIFLLTDEEGLRSEYRLRFPTTAICCPPGQYGSDLEGTTAHTPDVDMPALSNAPSPLPSASARETLVAILLACRCDYFIGNRAANTALTIHSMKAWPANFAFLFGNQSARGENLSLYAL